MSLLGEITGLLRDRGTDIAAELHEAGLSAADIAEHFGCSHAQAGAYRRTARALFSPLPDPGAAADRERALALGKTHRLSLDALAVINTQICTVAKDIDYPRERLRREITEECGGKTTDEIKQLAAARVRELNKNATTRPRPRAYASEPDGNQMFHLNSYLDYARTSAFRTAWGQRTEQLYQRDDNTSYHHAAALALEEILAAGVGKLADHSIGVHAIITTDELGGRIERDTVLLTSGAEMPLEEVLNNHLADTGWLVIHDHLSGLPERAFRIARHANDKQRAMLAGHQVFCAAPGCSELALCSQAHHITAWRDGGETNIDNLAMLCRMHHAMVTNGLAELTLGDDGKYHWHELSTGRRATNEHPSLRYCGANLAKRE